MKNEVGLSLSLQPFALTDQELAFFLSQRSFALFRDFGKQFIQPRTGALVAGEIIGAMKSQFRPASEP